MSLLACSCDLLRHGVIIKIAVTAEAFKHFAWRFQSRQRVAVLGAKLAVALESHTEPTVHPKTKPQSRHAGWMDGA